MRRTTVVTVVLTSCLVAAAVAETRKEFRFTVSGNDKANVSVNTLYGSITVKPGEANRVAVIALLQSDKVKVDHLQKGNRVEIESQGQKGLDQQAGRVDYELQVPPNATLTLNSSTGPLVVDRLRGDLTLEGAAAPVEVRNSGGGHVRVNTMTGPITLTDVRSAHVEITSISGDIHLNSVSGPKVQVNSTNGRIFYDGDFGQAGDYAFTTHTGDIEASMPASTSADFNAQSLRGDVRSDVSLVQNEPPKFPLQAGRSFFGTIGKAASEVVFKSISGKIRLKKR